jgi:Sugar (and other) transporter
MGLSRTIMPSIGMHASPAKSLWLCAASVVILKGVISRGADARMDVSSTALCPCATSTSQSDCLAADTAKTTHGYIGLVPALAAAMSRVVVGLAMRRVALPPRLPDRLLRSHLALRHVPARVAPLADPQGPRGGGREVIAAIAGKEANDKYVENEFGAIKATVVEMSQGQFSDLFARDKNRTCHRTLIAFFNQMFQQISGINLITYYAAEIYRRIGMSPTLSRLLAALNGTEYFLRHDLAVPGRDHAPAHARARQRPVHLVQLDLQLHGRHDHAGRL